VDAGRRCITGCCNRRGLLRAGSGCKPKNRQQERDLVKSENSAARAIPPAFKICMIRDFYRPRSKIPEYSALSIIGWS
jgi:hypothetical protein